MSRQPLSVFGSHSSPTPDCLAIDTIFLTAPCSSYGTAHSSIIRSRFAHSSTRTSGYTLRHARNPNEWNVAESTLLSPIGASLRLMSSAIFLLYAANATDSAAGITRQISSSVVVLPDPATASTKELPLPLRTQSRMPSCCSDNS